MLGVIDPIGSSWDTLVLFTLYSLFLVPVVLRASEASTPWAEIQEALRHPSRMPVGVWVHTAGGLLVGSGVAVAALGSRVGPMTTPRALVGALALLGAAAIGVAALVTLRSWRLLPRVDDGHELCVTGPYAWVRHPIYVAIDLVGVGSVLWVPEWAVVAGALLFVIGGDLRARAEESVLVAHFGDRYRDYARRVPRWIPRPCDPDLGAT